MFRSVADLQAAINRYIEEHNDDPELFVWTANPDIIIGAVKRGHQDFDPLGRTCQEGPPLLLPFARDSPCQLLQLHHFRLPPIEDRLDDFGRQESQP